MEELSSVYILGAVVKYCILDEAVKEKKDFGAQKFG